MESLIENIKATIWAACRNIRAIKLRFCVNKPLFCCLGFHKMRRGFGWSGDKRMDICLRNRCNYSKWHKDKAGNELMLKQIKKTQHK